MADYHPLIARAVAGLEKNTGENRRTLYERARTALVAQLRGVQPALDESEITRERLALEEAIRKVEAEAARHAREIVRPNVMKQAEAPHREAPPRAAPTATRPGSPAPRPQAMPGAPPPASASGAARRATPEPTPRGFQHNVAEAATLRRAENLDRAYPPQPMLPPAPSIPAPERNALEEYGQLEPQMEPENLWALPLDGMPAPTDFDEAAQHAPHPPPPQEAEQQEPAPRVRPPRSYSGLIRTGLLLILIGAVGAMVYWKRSAIGGLASSIVAVVRAPSTPTPREAPAPAQPKISDRIGQPAPQPSAAVPVAQRVVLYEEDPQDSQGKRYVGTVLWRTEMKPAGPGRPPELAVRGDIDIPERKMTVTFSLRRNTDPSLPASHTIEIMFNMPTDSPSGGVHNVPGVLMKQAEQTRGVPLAGLAVKVTPGFFLIGLSALETDMQRNLQLLKERSWFDIPIVYNNNRRAILALEKGTPGEKAFAEAFAAWRQ